MRAKILPPFSFGDFIHGIIIVKLMLKFLIPLCLRLRFFNYYSNLHIFTLLLVNVRKLLLKLKPFTAEHPFHILPPSIWPFLTSISVLNLALNFVFFLSGYTLSVFNFVLSLFFVCIVITGWLNDVFVESYYGGFHTNAVSRGLRLGFLLFIASEIMFFSTFFVSFFFVSFAGSVSLGNVWPIEGLGLFTWFELPLLNTFILLYSSVLLTAAHSQWLSSQIWPLLLVWTSKRGVNLRIWYLLRVARSSRIFLGKKKYYLNPITQKADTRSSSIRFPRTFLFYFISKFKGDSSLMKLFFVVIWGFLFLGIQIFEYTHLNVSINYSVFGSIFFVLTGFHGLHVVLGIVALGLSLSLMRRGYVTVNNPLSFECAIWYWHFVDTIWLLVLSSVYVWGQPWAFV